MHNYGIKAMETAVENQRKIVNEHREALAKCDDEIAFQNRSKQTIAFNLERQERALTEIVAALAKLKGEGNGIQGKQVVRPLQNDRSHRF